MRLEFWGTRGSIAKPGPTTTRYGGNTSCVEVRSAQGTLLILDCGTGGHVLGQKLMSAGRERLRGHILISHTHWDHIQGIPFFAPLFVPGNEWDIYGPQGLGQSLREALAGQMQYAYFPLALEECGATIRYHDLVEGVFEIDDVKVYTQYLNHPALTLGYRLEADGVAVVYSCDHEPHSRRLASGRGKVTGQDWRHAEFMIGADLLIHDAQYTAEEYPAKLGWGHSSVEYVVKLAQCARVKRVALTHHDPLRDDDVLDRIVADVRGRLSQDSSSLDVFAAFEGQVVDLAPSSTKRSPRPVRTLSAEMEVDTAITHRSVLLWVTDKRLAASLSAAIRAEGIQCKCVANANEVRKYVATGHPSLAVFEHEPPRIYGADLCRVIRDEEKGKEQGLPIVIVAAQEDQALGAAAGVTDWLIKPFTSAYVRTKVRAWLLRTACQWMRAPIPDDEERRVAALRALRILDTQPEERFDRITRLASALFDVPIALVSLVDEDRQWFKSCHGLEVKETPRDAAFCAHVVYQREPLVVQDTLLDERFADNPLVMNEPRMRFYAGCPLILPNGACIGSLCIGDRRPHFLDASDLARLRDLADLVLKEINAQ